MLAEVVQKLKRTQLQAASPAHCYTRPGDVECDFCTGRKLKAIKSSLMCQASFCETHLKPHYEVLGLKKHKLINASSQLQEKICYMCMMYEHRGHDTVAAVAEINEKQRDLMEVQRKFQLRIQEKEKKVQELKQAVDTLKRFAQAAVNNNRRIFTELIRSIKQRRCEVRDLIRAQEEAELSRAERLLEQLEQEIADLKRRDTELEQFSQTDDDIHFLQSFQSLCVSSGSEDSPSIPVHQHPSFDGVKKSISDLKERLKEFCKEEFNKILQHAAVVQILPSEPKTREDFLKYFCQLSLDANTTHRRLSLSERNKVVTRSEKVHLYSDHPERFDYLPQVLSKKSVCGCCYWEVELSNGSYVFISVSYKDISRKGHGKDCMFGFNNQSWRLQCFSTLSFWHNNIKNEIPGPPSSRIGVYVDHSAGTLSF
ncbi:tripartite motif-containing protein 16-like [Electrophorus electricus]|uniref:tripartite motif-containing protein 16-like n=1 Tax=Electrophorus electricus TaxID=8005 RepID=UPI0015CFADCC|nr:tripartite motif-containing protein 16-like [Electrophorus electricus]